MTKELHFTDDFAYPTDEEWQQAAEKLLKGIPFEKLITKTYEDITLKPMYRQKDMPTANESEVTPSDFLPGFAPYVRGNEAAGYKRASWEINQEIPASDPETFNKALCYDLERGQTTANIKLGPPTQNGTDADQSTAKQVGYDGLSLSTFADIKTALKNINLEQTPIFIQAGASGLPLTALIVAFMTSQDQNIEKLRGCLAADPFGILIQNGTLPQSLEQTYDQMANVLQWAITNAPHLQTILVNGQPYHESGGNAIQELAYTLATGVEYVRNMQKRGLGIDEIAPRIRFSFSIGSHFFMEIAKLRAARVLWAKIIKAFGGNETSQKMNIHCRTARWNKTVFDAPVNMLRATIEAFASIVGGCNSLQVGHYDEIIRQPNEFSRRIARNIQIILKEECNLYRLIDPVGGSWYVENLTDALGRKAWAHFQDVEKMGGILAALQDGFPQTQVAEIAQKRTANIATRKDKFVGTNIYANLSEKPLEVDLPDYKVIYQLRCNQIAAYRKSVDQHEYQEKLTAFTQQKTIDAGIEAVLAGATLSDLTQKLRSENDETITIKPIHIHRGTEKFECLRKQVEEYTARVGNRPQVFLANMGPVSQHKARADFSKGFFEVGGFNVISDGKFATIDEAAQAALASDAPVVVICSTDATYPELVPPLTKKIKDTKPENVVILAGYPKDQVETHRMAGVDEFIHIKANVYEILSSILRKIGVIS